MDAIKVAKVDNVVVTYPNPISTSDPSPSVQKRTGTIHLTPHHLIFSPSPSTSSHATANGVVKNDELWIPYPIIALCTRLPRDSASRLFPVSIRTRTFETYVFLFEEEKERGAEDVWQSVKDCAVACESPPSRSAVCYFHVQQLKGFHSVRGTAVCLFLHITNKYNIVNHEICPDW